MFTYDVWPAAFPTNTQRWLVARFAGAGLDFHVGPSGFIVDNCVEVRGFPSEEAAWTWVRMISYED